MHVETDPAHAAIREIRSDLTKIELEIMDAEPRLEYINIMCRKIILKLYDTFSDGGK